MALKIKIDNEVYQKIMCWINESNFEVSGFGNVILEEDGTFRVISATLTKQENRATETDIKAEDVAKALFESRDEDGEMRWWWHSHVNMAVFWSGTDHQAMRDFASTPDSWAVCTVFNKKNEHRSCFFAPQGAITPFGQSVLMFDELPTTIEPYVNPKVAEWKAEYAAKVTNFTYKHWTSRNNTGEVTSVTQSKRPAAQKPPGMSKRDWKALRKKQAEDEKLSDTKVQGLAPTEDSNFEMDAYGFTQEERTLLSMSGWDLHDIDALLVRKFTARQINLLCEADYLADDVIKLMDEEHKTMLEIMKDVTNILLIRTEVKGNIKQAADDVEIDDDIPVADRGRSVIDMRQGQFDDLYDQDNRYCGY